jgi:hypothetical protein
MILLRVIWLSTFFLMATAASSQHQSRLFNVAVTNHHSAYPFSAFTSLFVNEFHPGVEIGYGFNWKTAPKHDFFQGFKAGYFYHRFVQHAIPIYTQFGYRYKIQALKFSAAIGAGYLHSIPATAVYQLNSDGTYKNAKGIGRGQLSLNFTLGAQYNFNKKIQNSTAVFIDYQQLLQMPFIKSYVPLLPYNGIAVGLSIPLKLKN